MLELCVMVRDGACSLFDFAAFVVDAAAGIASLWGSDAAALGWAGKRPAAMPG
jgi:hypothetical protein